MTWRMLLTEKNLRIRKYASGHVWPFAFFSESNIPRHSRAQKRER